MAWVAGVVPRALLAAALLALPFALAGCADGAGGESEPQWVEVDLPGRHMLDLEYTLSGGTVLDWEWETTSPLAFQALYVNGASAYPLSSEYGQQGSGERTAPQAGRYDLTWDNQRSANVTLRFIVPEGYRQRIWLPGEGGPGCPPAGLLGESPC